MEKASQHLGLSEALSAPSSRAPNPVWKLRRSAPWLQLLQVRNLVVYHDLLPDEQQLLTTHGSSRLQGCCWLAAGSRRWCSPRCSALQSHTALNRPLLLTRRANGSFRINKSVLFWYFLISCSARVPGL